jgi:hypothetical protein
MYLIIKPNENSIKVLLETEQYKKIWKQYKDVILKSFVDVTGLDFQQTRITARVIDGGRSHAGNLICSMKLAGDYRSIEFKLITIIHELSHRLLGGNALGVESLGLVGKSKWDSDEAQEMDHRHIYLFEYDVVKSALGKNWVKECRKYEERGDRDSPHDRAWRWAMGMAFSKRQAALKILASKAITRDKWEKVDWDKIKLINAKTWYQRLEMK